MPYVPDICAIDINHRIAVVDDGTLIPIITLVDDCGDETSDLVEAFGFVAGPYRGTWFTGRISSFDHRLN